MSTPGSLPSLGSDDDDLSPDQRKETEIIKKNRVKLTEYIHDVAALFPFMKEREVFTKSDCELVKNETTSSARVDRFIDILLTKGPRAVGVFHESLSHHCTHLFNYLCNLFMEAGIELPQERQTVHSAVYDGSEGSPADSVGGWSGWRRVHSTRVKQSLEMLTSQIEKIQGERDSFRSILIHREAEMEDLFRSKMEQLEEMKEALSLDEASRAVIGLKNERDKIQNEYEKLDAEYMLTSLELCAARDRIQKLSCQLEQYEHVLAVNVEDKEDLQTQLDMLDGHRQYQERRDRRLHQNKNITPYSGQVNVSELLRTVKELSYERQQALDELDDMRSENCRLKTLHSQLSVDSVTSRGIFMAGTMSGSEGYGTMGTVGNETVEDFPSHLKQFAINVDSGHDCGKALDLQLGVYVSSIPQGSSFEKAGVQCGDIIMQVNSIKISEDSSPLDLVRRILDSASEVHLALLRTVGWSEMPSCRAHLPRPTINAYDTSDEESCTGRRPSRLRLSPTPTRQRSPSGCVTETASFGKALHTGRHGQQLLLFPPHEPQRSISAPSSPRNKSTVHLTPYRRNMHCFHSDHSDEDSSDSCPMGSPIRHVFASRPRLNSHSYVNCHFPIQSQNGSIRQPAAVEQESTGTLNGRRLFNMAPAPHPWRDTQHTSSLPQTFVDRVNCGIVGGHTAPTSRKLSSDVPRAKSKSPFEAIFRPLKRNGLHRRSVSEKDLTKMSNTIWYA